MITTTRNRFLYEEIKAIPGYLDVNRNGVSPLGTKFPSGNSVGVSSPGAFPYTFDPRDSIYLVSAKMECEVETGLVICADSSQITPNYRMQVQAGLILGGQPNDFTNFANLHFYGFEKIQCRHKALISPQILPAVAGTLMPWVAPVFSLEVFPTTVGAETGHVFKTDLLDPSLLNKIVSYSIVCEWEHTIRPLGM